jgi:trigger factor
MQVTVEDVNSVKKILHIEIPENVVTGEMDKAYRELKKTAKIKGFRPGKAPRNILERHFSKDVNADVASRLIQKSFLDALQETDLNIIGDPKIEPPDFKGNAAYNYDATVEIKPQIGEIDFKGLSLKRSTYNITDEEIGAQLKLIQKNMAQKSPIQEDRPSQAGDFLVIDYEGLKDGQPFEETEKTDNFIMKLGDHTIIKEFDDALTNLNAGESTEFEVTFPSDYFNEKMADQTIQFKVSLKEIREEVLPELNDEFAKSLGQFESMNELRTRIKENLTNGYDKRVEQELNEQVFQALIDQTDFELPDTLVEHELRNIITEAQRAFTSQGKSFEEAGITEEGLSEKYRGTAEKQVRRYLILNKIVDQEKLTLSDDELKSGFQEMAATVNQPAEQIKSYYDQNKESLEFFKHALLEKKAIKLIISSSEIEDVDPEAQSEEEDQEKSD